MLGRADIKEKDLNKDKAIALLENLIERIERKDSRELELSGKITRSEFDALVYACNFLVGDLEADSTIDATESNEQRVEKNSPEPSSFNLNMSVFDMPMPPESDFLCLDFGTALSKVAIGHLSDGVEDTQILEIGIPGEQENLSTTKLESAVYIDNAGMIWFGQTATERAEIEQEKNEDRAIVQNIKRFLSEGDIEDRINERMNPTHFKITNRDIILAYLTFLTWCVNERLSVMGVPRNIRRRFAMPCLKGTRRDEVIGLMKSLLGEAQVLADTFGEGLAKGFDLDEFLRVSQTLRKQNLDFPFIDQEIVEPLAVTGAIMSFEKDAKALLLVIDIGAGTTDFGLFLVRYSHNSGASSVDSIENGYDVISKAGNFIDRVLIEYTLNQSGIDNSHPRYKAQRNVLQRNAREYKETLFSDGSVAISMLTADVVTIELKSFVELKQIQALAEEFQQKLIGILERVDNSHIVGAPYHNLALKITGGGANLPFVQKLYEQKSITIKGTELSLKPVVTEFPEWLTDTAPYLKDDFAQLSVAIGGARFKKLNYDGEITRAIGVGGPVEMGGYYTKGS